MTDSALMEVDNDPAVGEKRKADKGKAPMSVADEAKKNQMWVEKYRPSRLADVAAHKDIIDTISRLSTEDKLPHLLLYGPPGTGKTSTILALAKELYGASFAQMVLELNASDGTHGAREGPHISARRTASRGHHPRRQIFREALFKFSRISRLTFPFHVRTPKKTQIAASTSCATRSSPSRLPCVSAAKASSSSSWTSATV